MTLLQGIKRAAWLAIALALVWGVFVLEQDRAAITHTRLQTQAGPVELYHQGAAPAGPLVLVTHGFAGSVQLMQTISRDLARAGFSVATFDFYGHGRNATRLSRDITRIEGTTLQLVDQTRAVLEAVRQHTDVSGPTALIGHSMATDIIIRAAQDLPDIAAIVAISMYSEAVTDTHPANLLVISGEWEHRLRSVGLDAVHLIDPQAAEGDTVTNGLVQRRTTFAPNTEHTAVLFSKTTLQDIRDWLGPALSHPPQGAAHSYGLVLLGVLAMITALVFPAARLLPNAPQDRARLSVAQFVSLLILPAAFGVAGLLLMPGTVLGSAAFGHLIGFFGAWGLAALALLARFGRRLIWPDLRGTALLLIWALIFALALDRYGAAFLPTGPRLPLMGALVLGTVPFLLADRLLVTDAAVWRRVLSRALPILVLSSAMVLVPTQVGLMFTVLPVMILFYVVYGTMGHAVAARSGPEAAGLGLGVILAWAIAASTPLFVG